MPPIPIKPLIIQFPNSTCASTHEQSATLAADRQTSVNWLTIFQQTFGHVPHLLEVRDPQSELLGFLPLCFVKSRLFGRFLVSLPYLNSAGVATPFPNIATLLIERAVKLADELNVKYLELRHDHCCESPFFNGQFEEKVHMRLDLPPTTETLWNQLKPKVRNQIRKGESHDLQIEWGRSGEMVRDFYRVFSRNMRDLGTPVYTMRLFENILSTFPESELAVTYMNRAPVAVAYLQHNVESTAVPSASSLRCCKSTNANMWMYWQLLSRAIERAAPVFDFGRSTKGAGTYRFKKQWGAKPDQSIWQYYRRRGETNSVRPTNPKYNKVIKIWQQMPLWMANLLGPHVVRGIP